MSSLKNKFVRILESDDWIIDYCKETNRYRVSYFEDNHFVDDILFDAYENKKTSLSEALEKYNLVECKLSEEAKKSARNLKQHYMF